jgi:hypothetical protein
MRRSTHAGVDQIFLFFDDPQDPALEVLDGVSPRVTSVRCDAAFWRAQRVKRPAIIEHRQLVNANLGLAWARQYRFDWIIHIDSDELLLADVDLRDILSAEKSAVVRFPMKEAVAEREAYPSRFHTTLFREPLPPARIASLSSEDRASVLFEGEYFRGHTASKAAIRVSSAVQSVGIHGPAKPRLAERQSGEITLLHYDCIGLEDWKRKWERRLDGSGTADGMRPGRLRQLELFKHAYGKPAQERELYARLHMASVSQRDRLVGLGVMSVIDRVPGVLRTMRHQARCASLTVA